jgi:hypothetical protein
VAIVDVADENRLKVEQERVVVRVLRLENVKGLQVQGDKGMVLSETCKNVRE